MRHNQGAAVAAATAADEARSALLADLLGRVAGCFPRRETRQSCGQMLHGLLMELDDRNCWTIAEAAGHRGPHRPQHLLSRAVRDDQQVLDIASGWAVSHLDDGDAVLIVDETADEKSSADCAGAARSRPIWTFPRSPGRQITTRIGRWRRSRTPRKLPVRVWALVPSR